MSTFTFLGITVSALNMNDLHLLIGDAVAKNRTCLIGHHNLHSLYIYHHEPRMRDFYKRADFVHIDGMPLIFLGRLLGYPLRRIHRVTYVDWISPLLQEAARQNFRVFFVGSKPGVAAQAEKILKAEIPGLQMKTFHGYFDFDGESRENQKVLESIKAYKPNILMVGMGMPRQEYWILDNLGWLNANIVLTAGACMDYVAGIVPVPPRWMGQLGLEWFYRLLCEPRRLWRRYLLEPWFVLKLLWQEFRCRKNIPGA